MSLGVGGTRVEMGAHICGFFRDQAFHDEILRGFVAEAVGSGHMCFCLVDLPDPTLQPSDRLEILTPPEWYASGDRFSAEATLTRLEALVARALEHERYPAVRVVADMTWSSSRSPALGEVCLYESELNRLADRYPLILLCLYDLSRFPAEAVVEVHKTHPWVLGANVVFPNPYFLEPGRFPGDLDGG